MKIPSVYTQSHIASKTAPVWKSLEVKPAEDGKPVAPVQKTAVVRKSQPLQFSPVAERVLSSGEKLAIRHNFGEQEGKFARAYTPAGKTVNMEVMIGRKIDVKG